MEKIPISDAHHKEAVKRLMQKMQSTKNIHNARVFQASLQEAEKAASQILASEKKRREEFRKRKDRKNKKEDFEYDDEIDQILSEIDKRMAELRNIGKKLTEDFVSTEKIDT